MLQVRTPGQDATESAEVQAAFAQIVCRALWEERTRSGSSGPVQAERMLHQYLDATLEGLGPLKEHAQRLLGQHLIDAEGSRVLLMEETAGKALEGLSGEDATKVLRHLQEAAVLRATEHQGSRYFELGHDWLARKVLELRKERERKEQEQRARERARRRRKRARPRRSRRSGSKRRHESSSRNVWRGGALSLLAGGAVLVAVLMAGGDALGAAAAARGGAGSQAEAEKAHCPRTRSRVDGGCPRADGARTNRTWSSTSCWR